jgi:hypothetical protein
MEMQQIVQILAKLQASQNDNQAAQARIQITIDSNQTMAAKQDEMLPEMKADRQADQRKCCRK